jgi:hypothetical protein
MRLRIVLAGSAALSRLISHYRRYPELYSQAATVDGSE